MKELILAVMTVCIGTPDCSVKHEQHDVKIEKKDCGVHRYQVPVNGEWVESEIRFKC
jgi:hypothetical protein